MSNLDNWIDKINNTPGLSSAEKKELRKEARELASGSGNLTAKDREKISSSIGEAKGSGSDKGKPTPLKPINPSPPNNPPETIVTPPVVTEPPERLPGRPRPTPPYKPDPPQPTPTTPSPARTVAATPSNPWDTKSTYTAPTGVKQANPDVIIFDDSSVDGEYISQAFFDEFGGTELVKISRSDTIGGAPVSYSLIGNLFSIAQNNNSLNIINISPFQETGNRYAVNLYARGMYTPYFNDYGELIVEIDEVKDDEYIEIQTSVDGTITLVGEL